MLLGRLAPESREPPARRVFALTSFETFDALAAGGSAADAIPEVIELTEAILRPATTTSQASP